MSKFSDFIRRATGEERARVFDKALESATARQNAIIREGWELRKRPTGPVWVHASKPVWVVHFEAFPGLTRESYRAYIAIEKPRNVLCPWTADNRSIHKDGFASLSEAMQAAEAA